jgi:formylglycine-generating enzyme required for sulfatase activity
MTSDVGERALDAAVLRGLPDDDYVTALAVIRAHFEAIEDSEGLSKLCSYALGHPEWRVRALAVEVLTERHHTDVRAREAVGSATHDPVDGVAFTAIRAVGERRMTEAIGDLIRISGWPSNFTREGYARKPVGVGAALTKRALLDIFGSTDAQELRALEDEHFRGLREQVEQERRRPDLSGAVFVPGGPFIAGWSGQAIGPFQMDTTDNPLRAVDLPAFWIDRTAVTNRRYAEFMADVGDTDAFRHADDEPGKDRTPSHWRDPRFDRPDQPVVGMDWYDAWSFARWAGGRLPSEEQWEKAARGCDGRLFPWGQEWDPERANHVERSFGAPVRDLDELEALIRTVSPTNPPHPVMAADSLPGGASPYGALHMSGNVWELTRTNFFSLQDMNPFFRGRREVEYMNRPEAFHVLRGGTWTSPPVCLATPYRGRDLLTDRHNEVGFRCVYEVGADGEPVAGAG